LFSYILKNKSIINLLNKNNFLYSITETSFEIIFKDLKIVSQRVCFSFILKILFFLIKKLNKMGCFSKHNHASSAFVKFVNLFISKIKN